MHDELEITAEAKLALITGNTTFSCTSFSFKVNSDGVPNSDGAMSRWLEKENVIPVKIDTLSVVPGTITIFIYFIKETDEEHK